MTDITYGAIRALLQSKCITKHEHISGDEDPHWTWPQNSHNKWDALNDGFHEFCAHWYGRTFDFDQKPPYTLDLGLASTHGNEPVIRLYEASHTDFGGSEILVTEEYIDMYCRILDRATSSSYGRGVLITGQPGIGKTMLEKFMVARLLSERQIVLYLLESRSEAYLFYHNQVYRAPIQQCFRYLPQSKKHPRFVWTLINADTDEGPRIDPGYPIWPLQLCSPNTARYKTWCKHFGAARWGMGVWTEDQLWAGLRLQPEYEQFRSGLENAIRASNPFPTSSV